MPKERAPIDYTLNTHCRGCGSTDLESVLNLGQQSLTGVFPKTPDQPLAKGPLEIVRCKVCTLVQLKHRFDPEQMYGDTYGYRSGLNRSMVEHLSNKVAVLQRRANLQAGDTVLDIGCNDGTLLHQYTQGGLHRYGIDPSSTKFLKHYTDPSIKVAGEFFNAQTFRGLAGEAKCKLVTSIAMFYDLDDPTSFAKDIAGVLAPDGIWHTEQSYLPTMLDTMRVVDDPLRLHLISDGFLLRYQPALMNHLSFNLLHSFERSILSSIASIIHVVS